MIIKLTLCIRTITLIWLFFSATKISAQATVSGLCITGSPNLSSVPNVNGKVAYSGTGTVAGSTATINIYWIGTPDNVWVLDFDGQPYFSNPANTSLPPAAPGAWSVVTTGCTGASPLSITGSGVLPVELVSFKAEMSPKKQVQLSWLTASEINNKGFEVQRSDNAKEWSTLTFVAGKGTTTTTQSYSFIDETPLRDIGYYRLNQVDYDGGEKASPIVSVNNSEKLKFSFSPNPSKGQLVVNTIKSLNNTPLSITVRNLLGQAVFTKTTEQDQTVLDISNYPAGTYLMEIRYQNSVYYEKIIKE